jgi:hypothetical protein
VLPETDRVKGEEDDTRTSPQKKNGSHLDDRESTDSGVKRRLELGFPNPNLEDDPTLGRVPMITDGAFNQEMLLVETENERTKCSKKAGANFPSL